MKTNRIKAALCAIAAALAFAACSNMMEELKPTPQRTKDLVIKGEPKCENGVITIVVQGTVPTEPKPTITYTFPDGIKKTLQGTVTDNGDGTATLTFDTTLEPEELPEGPMDITVSVSGYNPADVSVDYQPPTTLS